MQLKPELKRDYFAEKPLPKVHVYWYWFNLKMIAVILNILDNLRKLLSKRIEHIGLKMYGLSDFHKYFESKKN